MGIDGCPAGWCAFTGTTPDNLTFHVFENLAALWHAAAFCRLVLIDIPIGLPDGKRECDLQAKAILGRFNSRVFLTPPRAVVYATAYADAAKVCKAIAGFGLAKQTWNICPKIRSVDEFLRATPGASEIIRECHPEICFWGFGGRVLDNKATDEGFEQRLDVLTRAAPATPDFFRIARAAHRAKSVSNDDILDALVAAVTALAPLDQLRTLPSNPPRDAEGLLVEMVYRTAPLTPALRSRSPRP